MAGRLAGKVAIVTGAARGQGEGVARAFVDEGAKVALFDVLDEQGASVANSLGANAKYFHCDVSREAEVKAAVDGAVAQFGKLDILYNNAAVITYGNRIADMPVEQWDRTMAINLRGPFLCAKHAIPHLLNQGGGAIIIVSSHGAFQAAPVGVADYATAKGGLVTLTYYLASEYGSQRIRTNCIAPGPVPTALNEPFLGSEEGRAMTAAFIPLGTVGAVEDVARAAVFLASDEAKWITGAVLRVDGGMVIQ
jgi:NAD(P)-dependent dehydrogenase (short-subunit alcohol dehydrogenase family)